MLFRDSTTFTDGLKQLLESEEESTVSDAFGGNKTAGRTLP